MSTINAHLRAARASLKLWDKTPKTSKNSGENSSHQTEALCLKVLGYIDELHLGKYSIPDTADTIQTFLQDCDLPKALETQENNAIVTKITAILDDTENGVADTFTRILREESMLYTQAYPKLLTVALAQKSFNQLFKKLVQTYLTVKRTNNGTLSQSAKDNIAQIYAQREHIQSVESWERANASESAQWFLIAQKLLWYKQAKNQTGFVLTPSRLEIIERITREVMAGRRVFLVGSTGTGKTEMAMYVADTVSGGYEMLSWHGETKPRDLFGQRELWTDERGKAQTRMSPGPLTRGIQSDRAVIHDEFTTGPTQTHIAMKSLQNAQPGDQVQIPGFSWEVHEIGSKFIELYTGNLSEEKTRDRTDMDPAVLRMLTGIGIDYMPPEELRDIILSDIITDSGILPLTRAQIGLIEKLTNIARMMQFFHERQFDTLTRDYSTDPSFALLTAACPGNTLANARLDKVFLDPGTLISWFAWLDFTLATSGTLETHIADCITQFLRDPKNANKPEEKRLIQGIFQFFWLVNETWKVTLGESDTATQISDPSYIRPSQLARVFRPKLKDGEELPPSEWWNPGKWVNMIPSSFITPEAQKMQAIIVAKWLTDCSVIECGATPPGFTGVDGTVYDTQQKWDTLRKQFSFTNALPATIPLLKYMENGIERYLVLNYLATPPSKNAPIALDDNQEYTVHYPNTDGKLTAYTSFWPDNSRTSPAQKHYIPTKKNYEHLSQTLGNTWLHQTLWPTGWFNPDDSSKNTNNSVGACVWSSSSGGAGHAWYSRSGSDGGSLNRGVRRSGLPLLRHL
jgi:MoxR-like ATPase